MQYAQCQIIYIVTDYYHIRIPYIKCTKWTLYSLKKNILFILQNIFFIPKLFQYKSVYSDVPKNIALKTCPLIFALTKQRNA